MIRSGIVRSVARITRVWGDRWNARPLHAIYRPELRSALEEIVDNGGIKLKLSTASELEWNIYFYSWRWFEPEVRAVIIDKLRPHDVAIDVGANIGIHTIVMARACTGGRVIAFEPNPFVWGRLEENLQINCLHNVSVSSSAVSDVSGQAILHVPDDVAGLQAWASLREGSDDYLKSTHNVSVSCTTIDDAVREEGLPSLRLIKIDTEGFEPEVLYGARSSLARFKPVLIFEYTKAWWAPRGHTIAEVVAMLQSIGYRTFKQVTRRGLSGLEDSVDRANLLAEP